MKIEVIRESVRLRNGLPFADIALWKQEACHRAAEWCCIDATYRADIEPATRRRVVLTLGFAIS